MIREEGEYVGGVGSRSSLGSERVYRSIVVNVLRRSIQVDVWQLSFFDKLFFRCQVSHSHTHTKARTATVDASKTPVTTPVVWIPDTCVI